MDVKNCPNEKKNEIKMIFLLLVSVEKIDVNLSTNEPFDDRVIADNGKRKYWNVTRDDQLVMNLTFFPNATKRDAELTCFAWS